MATESYFRQSFVTLQTERSLSKHENKNVILSMILPRLQYLEKGGLKCAEKNHADLHTHTYHRLVLLVIMWDDEVICDYPNNQYRCGPLFVK